MEQLHSNTIETSCKPGKHLTLDERGIIQALHQQGHSLNQRPRRILDYHSPSELFEAFLDEVYAIDNVS